MNVHELPPIEVELRMRELEVRTDAAPVQIFAGVT